MPSSALQLNPSSDQGFTLVEMAVVLIIVSLLTGGLMMTLSSQVEQRQRSEAKKQLEEAREALIGFAASHHAIDGKPHLPCPDTDGDGLENRNALPLLTCMNDYGHLPTTDLGLTPADPWGNRLRYHVHPNFARGNVGFTLSTTPNLRVCEQAACTSLIASAVPLVLVSGGRNGNGGGADELENDGTDRDYVSHFPVTGGANEFDDLVLWLSPSVLYNRLIAAGRLP